MRFSNVFLTTSRGMAESLSNMCNDSVYTLTDMIEDSKNPTELMDELLSMYNNHIIFRKPVEKRETDKYVRVTLQDRLGNMSYLVINNS